MAESKNKSTNAKEKDQEKVEDQVSEPGNEPNLLEPSPSPNDGKVEDQLSDPGDEPNLLEPSPDRAEVEGKVAATKEAIVEKTKQRAKESEAEVRRAAEAADIDENPPAGMTKEEAKAANYAQAKGDNKAAVFGTSAVAGGSSTGRTFKQAGVFYTDNLEGQGFGPTWENALKRAYPGGNF